MENGNTLSGTICCTKYYAKRVSRESSLHSINRVFFQLARMEKKRELAQTRNAVRRREKPTLQWAIVNIGTNLATMMILTKYAAVLVC